MTYMVSRYLLFFANQASLASYQGSGYMWNFAAAIPPQNERRTPPPCADIRWPFSQSFSSSELFWRKKYADFPVISRDIGRSPAKFLEWSLSAPFSQPFP
jgi:hypothetical protein